MFFKADIQLDEKGNIKKISSGDKIEVPFKTIDSSDIEVSPKFEIGLFRLFWEFGDF